MSNELQEGLSQSSSKERPTVQRPSRNPPSQKVLPMDSLTGRASMGDSNERRDRIARSAAAVMDYGIVKYLDGYTKEASAKIVADALDEYAEGLPEKLDEAECAMNYAAKMYESLHRVLKDPEWNDLNSARAFMLAWRANLKQKLPRDLVASIDAAMQAEDGGGTTD